MITFDNATTDIFLTKHSKKCTVKKFKPFKKERMFKC